ncbi:MAG: ATP-binding protein [Muribaculaceae bacterium]|nr:ATP-binding protein [Muribaculaceae bacterium]
MNIIRSKYLSRLESMMHTKFVKIITGIRRCGKSYLLFTLFANLLKEKGIDDKHIIKVDLDSFSNRKLRESEELYKFLNSQIKDSAMHYVLLDEIQLVPAFADILNEFLRRDNVDLYVTGSNAKLLSKDVITEFRGRGCEIKMYPLSFSEYMSAFNGSMQKGLQQYMVFGGLPQIFDFDADEQKAQFLSRLFEETYIRDIKQRYTIRKEDDLEELINLVSSNISCLTNPNKLANTFRSVKKSDISNETIKNYLDYLEDAFIINSATRFDIKGKKYIDTPFKYYFTDLGLRNARLNFRQIEKTHLMENVLYNELLYRGFNVDVGVVPTRIINAEGKQQRVQLEIDFVCNQGSKRYYIQSAYSMPTPDKVEQEETPLRKVDDFFKRIVVTGDEAPITRNNYGITTMSIYDFLLKDNSLEM